MPAAIVDVRNPVRDMGWNLFILVLYALILGLSADYLPGWFITANLWFLYLMPLPFIVNFVLVLLEVRRKKRRDAQCS